MHAQTSVIHVHSCNGEAFHSAIWQGSLLALQALSIQLLDMVLKWFTWAHIKQLQLRCHTFWDSDELSVGILYQSLYVGDTKTHEPQISIRVSAVLHSSQTKYVNTCSVCGNALLFGLQKLLIESLYTKKEAYFHFPRTESAFQFTPHCCPSTVANRFSISDHLSWQVNILHLWCRTRGCQGPN